MHDLTDDDRARLEGIAYGLETGYFRDGSREVCVFAAKGADLLRKLAEQSSGDQGLAITDEMVERGARAAFRSDRDHLGRLKNAEVPVDDEERSAIRKVLEAALTDSTDDQQED